MSEIKQFIHKLIAGTPNITDRKLYGLDSFYSKERPFIVITADERIAVYVESDELLKKLNYLEKWKLDGKEMKSWYLLPSSFNKKKNKLHPVIDLVVEALSAPKKRRVKPKKKKQKKVAEQVEVTPKAKGLLETFKSLFR